MTSARLPCEQDGAATSSITGGSASYPLGRGSLGLLRSIAPFEAAASSAFERAGARLPAGGYPRAPHSEPSRTGHRWSPPSAGNRGMGRGYARPLETLKQHPRRAGLCDIAAKGSDPEQLIAALYRPARQDRKSCASAALELLPLRAKLLLRAVAKPSVAASDTERVAPDLCRGAVFDIEGCAWHAGGIDYPPIFPAAQYRPAAGGCSSLSPSRFRRPEGRRNHPTTAPPGCESPARSRPLTRKKPRPGASRDGASGFRCVEQSGQEPLQSRTWT